MSKRSVRVLEVQGTSGYGGSEIHTRQLAEALHADPRFAVRVVIQPGGPVTAELRAAGIPVTELDLRNKFSRGARLALDEIIRAFQPDLVHTHIRNADWHGGRAARRHGRRWVTTIHDYINFDGQGRRTRGLPALVYRRLLRNSDGIIAISRHIAADTAEQLGLAAGRVTVIHNGSAAVRDNPADLRAELGLPAGTLLLGHIGRRTEHKGVAEFIAMLARLRTARPWHAVMVGAAADQDDAALRALAARSGVAERLTLLPARRDIAALLKALDLLVVTSRWEAFGRVVSEALAANCPVAAFAVGGIPEIIEDGVSGAMAPAGDAARLAARVDELLDDEARRALLRGGGHARWREHFTVERFQQATLEYLWTQANLSPAPLPAPAGNAGAGEK